MDFKGDQVRTAVSLDSPEERCHLEPFEHDYRNALEDSKFKLKFNK